jgi:hypothetical protein
MTASASAPGLDSGASIDANLQRPPFITEEVWEVVRLAAQQNGMPIDTYIEKALLDEAIILEQIRYNREWLVRNEKGQIAKVDFD